MTRKCQEMAASRLSLCTYSILYHVTRNVRNTRAYERLFFTHGPKQSSFRVNDLRSKYRNFEPNHMLMLCGGATLSLLACYIAYRNRKAIYSTVLPSVAAAKVFDRGNSFDDDSKKTNSRSLQLNFIADVVEKAAPAVVYIEIQGR